MSLLLALAGAVPPIPPTPEVTPLDTHDGYYDVSRHSRAKAETAHDDWERARREAVERAFADAFGENVAPVEVSAPIKREIVQTARIDLNTAGIEAKLSDLDRLVNEYLARIEAARLKRRNDDDAIILLMMGL
jgi:hypothetical protein